jgi:hypothetical protein
MQRFPIFAAGLFLLLTLAAPALAKPAQMPNFLLQETQDGSAGISPLADWHSERIITGIGWELATAARGDGPVMEGGLTVVQHSKAARLSGKHAAGPDVPLSLKHCYILAAFDLLPSGYLLVAVRDPRYYWPDYDAKQGVVDPVELVWYDAQWKEQQSLPLDYAENEFPDDFILSPDQRTLLAIKHPVDDSGEPAPDGQMLNIIHLFDGSINDVILPEADAQGNLPAQWQPVEMDWDKRGYLVLQAGKQTRRYEVKWE